MSDYTTKQIGEAREKSLSPATKEIQSWLFSPQFLAILGIAQIAGAICNALKEKSLPKAPNEGRTEVYSDVSIFITALVMKVWKLPPRTRGDNQKAEAVSTACSGMWIPAFKDYKQVTLVSKVETFWTSALLAVFHLSGVSVDSRRCNCSQRPGD